MFDPFQGPVAETLTPNLRNSQRELCNASGALAPPQIAQRVRRDERTMNPVVPAVAGIPLSLCFSGRFTSFSSSHKGRPRLSRPDRHGSSCRVRKRPGHSYTEPPFMRWRPADLFGLLPFPTRRSRTEDPQEHRRCAFGIRARPAEEHGPVVFDTYVEGKLFGTPRRERSLPCTSSRSCYSAQRCPLPLVFFPVHYDVLCTFWCTPRPLCPPSWADGSCSKH